MKKLSFLPALLVLGSLVGCGEPEDPWKDYTVWMDTRRAYDDVDVRLKVTEVPVCGNERPSGKGIKGAGVLEIPDEGTVEEVVISACMQKNEPAVRMPDGRVLFLKEK